MRLLFCFFKAYPTLHHSLQLTGLQCESPSGWFQPSALSMDVSASQDSDRAWNAGENRREGKRLALGFFLGLAADASHFPYPAFWLHTLTFPLLVRR